MDTSNPEKFIEGKYNQFIGSILKEVPELPPVWLSGSDELISLVSYKLPVEECVGIWNLSLNALRFVTGNDDSFGSWVFRIKRDECKIIIYDWDFLLRLAKEEGYNELKKECKGFGNLVLALGYMSIFLITLLRQFLYLEDNPESRDALYIHYGKELETDPKSKPYFEKALETLSKYSRRSYKKETHTYNEPDTGGVIKDKDYNLKIYSYLWDVVRESFGDAGFENKLVRTLKGDWRLKGIPLFVARDVIDEHRKSDKHRMSKKLMEHTKKRDLKFSTKYETTRDFEDIELIPEIANLSESERMQETATIKQLISQISSIPDPIDREIARLTFLEGFSLRNIESKLEISKSKIQRRLKKLTPL